MSGCRFEFLTFHPHQQYHGTASVRKGGYVRILIAGVFACLMATPTAFAQAADPTIQSEPKPSEESIRRLLDVMQAKKILQAVSEQMDATFAALVKKQLGNQELTPEQQQAIEARRKTVSGMVKDLLSWDSMESLYLKVYSETFTQSEIDGMLEFYTTATGQAVIAKLPLALKNTMAEMQERMRQMMPKLQQ